MASARGGESMSAEIIVGDAREKLRGLPTDSCHCCITSPPYWGLRAYTGESGMIGMEQTWDEHCENLVNVFREVRRVLRPDATLWLNYGDAYAGGGCGDSGGTDKQNSNRGIVDQIGGWQEIEHCKPKDLLLMPERLAMALQADGWWLRSKIIWHKPNPMPESVSDRPTSAHETIWLLAPSERYFYDAEAVKTHLSRTTVDRFGEFPAVNAAAAGSNQERRDSGRAVFTDKQRGHSRRHAGFNDRWDQMKRSEQVAGGANLRNVWRIPPEPYQGAHFAVFPTALVEPCMKAGTPEMGCCPACGQPWRRLTEDRRLWLPDCKCGRPDIRPATVIDPFAGSGTVGVVAQRMNRRAILIEVSQKYADMARDRITADLPLFSDVRTAEEMPQGAEPEQASLPAGDAEPLDADRGRPAPHSEIQPSGSSAPGHASS